MPESTTKQSESQKEKAIQKISFWEAFVERHFGLIEIRDKLDPNQVRFNIC